MRDPAALDQPFVIDPSKTVAQAAREMEGKAGASGLTQGIGQAWRHITQAISQATKGRLHAGWPDPVPANCALGLGLAGANNAAWHAECLAADPGYACLRLESDAVTALLGAHVYKGLSEAGFRRVVLALLTACGVAMVLSSLPAL